MSKPFKNNQKKRKDSMDWAELASFSHFIVSSMIFGVVFVLNRELSPPEKEPLIGSVGMLMIALTIYMLGLHFRERGNFKTYIQRVESLESEIDDLNTGHKVERYDNREHASRVILGRMAQAKEVKNTFFPNRNKRVGELISNPEAEDIFLAWIGSKQGELWHDIVGPEEFFDERYEIQKKSRVTGNKVHRINVLKHGITCPNFTLITYEDNSEEVFWGWISELHAKPNSEVPYVFSTREKEIIGFYGELFSVLSKQKTWGGEITRSYSSRSPLALSSPNQVVDKVGDWVNCAFRDGSLESVGYYQILVKTKPDGRRGFVMQGYTFDANGQVIDIINHVGKEISHYENKMFIEYGLNSMRGRKGFCFYEFREGGEMSGFYTDEESLDKFFIEGQKSKLEGFLLPDLPYAASAPAEIVDEIQGMLDTCINQGRLQAPLVSGFSPSNSNNSS